MIAIEDLHWSGGDFRLEGVCLHVPAGGYGVLMGPTGCGKTTLLELMCGLRQPDRGKVRIHGADVTGKPPGERGMGYVPQDSALFPAMPVARQLGFALEIRRRPPAQIRERVQSLAGQLGLTPLLLRMPRDLSGGERQRVALGRALAADPSVLLLDEPLSALDEKTRDELTLLLGRLRRERALTVLHVTHSRREALRLADCLFRMEGGRVSAAPLDGIDEGGTRREEIP